MTAAASVSSKSPPRRTVFFDFDGTISAKDTGLGFLIYCAGYRRLVLAGILSLGDLFCWKTGRITSSTLKERFFARMLRRVPRRTLLEKGRRFASSRLAGYLRGDALALLKQHKMAGDRCVLVSASLEEYLLPWGRAQGFEAVIATRMGENAFIDGNCAHERKVERILEHLKGDFPEKSVVYGNSSGDFAMMETALDRGGRVFWMTPGAITPLSSEAFYAKKKAL